MHTRGGTNTRDGTPRHADVPESRRRRVLAPPPTGSAGTRADPGSLSAARHSGLCPEHTRKRASANAPASLSFLSIASAGSRCPANGPSPTIDATAPPVKPQFAMQAGDSCTVGPCKRRTSVNPRTCTGAQESLEGAVSVRTAGGDPSPQRSPGDRPRVSGTSPASEPESRRTRLPPGRGGLPP